jgi:hypothetical protein
MALKVRPIDISQDKRNHLQFENQQVTIQADLERHKSLVSASTFSRAILRGY